MSLKTLSGDFAFYGVLDLAQRSISLVLVPLYTHTLSQDDFGRLDLLLIVLSVFVVLVDLQFVAGFTRFYLEYLKRDEGRQFVGTLLVIRLVAGVALAVAVVVAGWAGLLEASFIPAFSGTPSAWALVACLVPVSLTYDLLLLQARMLRRKRAFAFGALSAVLVSCALSVVFVAVFEWGLVGVLGGLLLGRIAGVVGLVVGLHDAIALTVRRSILGPLLAYSVPLIPGWWLAFGSAYIGRFFVFGTRGAEENALLALTMKVAGVIGLFSVSFRSAWQPLAMAHIGEAASEQFYVRSLRLFMAGGFLFTAVLGASLQPVLRVLAPDAYGVVESYFPLFAVGILLSEVESNLQLGNQIARRTFWISAGAFLYLGLNLVILLWLTSSMGIVAAGVGLVVAGLARTVMTYVSGQANYRIPYDRRAILLWGIGCGLFIVLGAAHSGYDVRAWWLRTAMLMLGIAVPWVMLGPAERRSLMASAGAALPARIRAMFG